MIFISNVKNINPLKKAYIRQGEVFGEFVGGGYINISPVTTTKNAVITPSGSIAPKHLRGKTYFFDGQIWGWR